MRLLYQKDFEDLIFKYAATRPVAGVILHLMHEDLEKVLFTQEQIHERIHALADEISRNYQGKEVMLVSVLKGAVFFQSTWPTP